MKRGDPDFRITPFAGDIGIQIQVVGNWMCCQNAATRTLFLEVNFAVIFSTMALGGEQRESAATPVQTRGTPRL
jgi:hypothetical protein